MINFHAHNRKSIRLKGYDYSQEGLYFITICCQDKICRFGHIENDEMICNQYGIVAYNEWIKTSQIRSNITLHEFVVMPNHIHGIIEINRDAELYSQNRGCELRSPNCSGELYSPVPKGVFDTPQQPDFDTSVRGCEFYSPNCSGELYSPIPKGVFNTPQQPDFDLSVRGCELRSQNCGCELHSPNCSGELYSPIPKGVSDTPQQPDFDTSVRGCELRSQNCSGELYSPVPKGVFDTPQQIDFDTSRLRSPSQTVGAIVRGYKSAVTKQLNALGMTEKLWQRNYYEHIIRNEQSYIHISEYIRNNPIQWINDRFYDYEIYRK